MTDKKFTIKYAASTILAVIFTWLLHEYAHWWVAKLLGYTSTMTFNGTFYAEGQNPTDEHKIIISAAGPIITLLQGILAFLILKLKHWNKFLYPFLFTAFYMRFVADIMNFKILNDEGRISVFLGLGTFTLSIIISGLLLLMTYDVTRKHEVSRKFQTLTILMVLIASSLLILLDQHFRIPIL